MKRADEGKTDTVEEHGPGSLSSLDAERRENSQPSCAAAMSDSKEKGEEEPGRQIPDFPLTDACEDSNGKT